MSTDEREARERLLDIIKKVTRMAIEEKVSLEEALNPFMEQIYTNSCFSSAEFREAIRCAVKETLYHKNPKGYLATMREVNGILERQQEKWEEE